MTREEIITNNPVERIFEERGVKVQGGGKQRMAKCPFHEDKSASLSINVDTKVWKCHAGCGQGSVIDAIAKFDGISPEDVLRRFSAKDKPYRPVSATKAPPEPTGPPEGRSDIEKLYQYRDAFGNNVYQVVRLKPKSFRQRHMDGSEWVWNMEGVERVLYRLPEVLKAQEVWVCEGEKDVETLVSLGFCATCNVGGAGKWLDSYTNTLKGKDVILCGDNDEPGQNHVKTVFESIAGKVNSTRIVKVPKEFKDATDYANGDCSHPEEGKAAFDALREDSVVFTKGLDVPLFTMAEVETAYIRHTKRIDTVSLDLGNWLEPFRSIRRLVPGELMTVLGDTGTGKSAVLQNIALAATPLRTIMFELELPDTLMFERFMAMKAGIPCTEIEKSYKAGEAYGGKWLSAQLPHLLLCTKTRLSVPMIEDYVNKSELKFGDRPQLVLIDYAGLMMGEGKSRYERTSDIAEGLKVMAKATNTIVVLASQVGRKGKDEDPELFLHDARDSGSIEASTGLLVGAWRDTKNQAIMYIKVLKNTKGKSGFVIKCGFDGSTMRITKSKEPLSEDEKQPDLPKENTTA